MGYNNDVAGNETVVGRRDSVGDVFSNVVAGSHLADASNTPDLKSHRCLLPNVQWSLSDRELGQQV
ncbi:hypothetical protein BMS3Bbin02_00919 [bacterium BMS3Bbin02]|nr:hypothetical protein BMS3Bbin02_00919 [bacterium BMS3Bbin02]